MLTRGLSSSLSLLISANRTVALDKSRSKTWSTNLKHCKSDWDNSRERWMRCHVLLTFRTEYRRMETISNWLVMIVLIAPLWSVLMFSESSKRDASLGSEFAMHVSEGVRVCGELCWRLQKQLTVRNTYWNVLSWWGNMVLEMHEPTHQVPRNSSVLINWWNDKSWKGTKNTDIHYDPLTSYNQELLHRQACHWNLELWILSAKKIITCT